MPAAITAYKIFIATPGGLEQEREAFRAAIKHYNESDAVPRGVLFIPIGWEITLPSFGRPQELINQDLRQCDYFVLVLWDRWGTPPSTEEAASYTSGTEEELGIS